MCSADRYNKKEILKKIEKIKKEACRPSDTAQWYQRNVILKIYDEDDDDRVIYQIDLDDEKDYQTQMIHDRLSKYNTSM